MDRKVNINNSGGFGLLWLGGWLFSIGYLHLDFWMGVLGIFIWPYFLGSHFAPAI